MMKNPDGILGTIGEVFTEEEIEAGYADNFDWDIYEHEKELPDMLDGWGYEIKER